MALPGRGASRWIIVQEIELSDPDRANERIKADIEGGADGFALRLPPATADGTEFWPPAGALRATFDGVDITKLHLRIDAAGGPLQQAKALAGFIIDSGLAPELADIAFCLDPLAAFLVGASADPEQFAASFLALRHARFRGPLAVLDGRSFHAIGATDAQELAIVLGGAVWWLRALAVVDVGANAALPLFGAGISVDADVILSIAKLRALRLLWGRLQELCDVARTPLKVHAETSRRMLTRDELTDNLLRNTLAAFAAGVGGADSILVVPHTAAIGMADRNARALARNLQHLLMDESDLHSVADPGAGAGTIEALTDQLAARAWSEFQAIERDGGIIESLRGGRLPARSAAARGTGEASA
jgi:methylmalonyl-CoA mutase